MRCLKRSFETLRQNEKVDWVVLSSMHNPIVLEQRKYDEEFDRLINTNRFKQNVTNLRTNSDPGGTLNFTQWGLSRHSKSSNTFVGVNTSSLSEDISYSLSGKNVDVVIMDTGVRWDHPDFLQPQYTSVPVGVSTESVSRVRDILIHGQDNYGINWASHGLVAPGSGTLSNYTIENVLGQQLSMVLGMEVMLLEPQRVISLVQHFKQIYGVLLVLIEVMLDFLMPSDGFDYIRVWHKNKPVNPVTGRKNPTIVNGSWGLQAICFRKWSYNLCI